MRTTLKKNLIYVISISLFFAFLLSIIPLPFFLQKFRPDWVLIVLIYWCIYSPNNAGIGLAWLMGIMQDALRGVLLGQHAFAYILIAYLAMQMGRRIKLFPQWQAAFCVMLLVFSGQVIGLWIRGIIGEPIPTNIILYSSLSTILAWPVVCYFNQVVTSKVNLLNY